MKMCAKLPLDGKNFNYVICNDGVRITGKLPITSELASLSICDLKLDVSLDGCHKVVISEVLGKYYLSTEVHYLWREFKGFSFPLSRNNNVRLLYYFKPITPPLYLSVFNIYLILI